MYWRIDLWQLGACTVTDSSLYHDQCPAIALFLFRHLVKCFVDSGKVEEAESYAKVTEDFIKSHTPHLYPALFTLLVNNMFYALQLFW